MQQPSPAEETSALLARLSQKPGVQSTLILSRDTGIIVRTSGLISRSEQPEQDSAPARTNGVEEDSKRKGMQSAEDVARLVWNFVKSTGDTIEELNGEDEVKLLRVRTRKNELVIVPDAKFLLVVIHDTPPA